MTDVHDANRIDRYNGGCSINYILTGVKELHKSSSNCHTNSTNGNDMHSSKSWNKKQIPNTENVAVTPVFSCTHDKIYYTTYYSLYRDSGIYCYDVSEDKHECIQLYKDLPHMTYYPQFHASSFSEAQQMIYFVGGDPPHDGLMCYDIKTQQMESIEFDEHIGCNPSLLCTNSSMDCTTIVYGFARLSEYMHDLFVPVAITQLIALFFNNDDLHIIGGENNNQHYGWNTRIRALEVIHTFNEYATGIRGQALLYNKQRHMMYMLGGCDEDNTIHYKDFWLYDTVWKKHKEWELPMVMCGFGAVVYDDRVIIIIGGRTCRSDPLHTIYYLDLENAESSWIEADVKCSFRGCCNAVLVRNESRVHVLPFGNYNRHVSIEIYALLPKALLSIRHRGYGGSVV